MSDETSNDQAAAAAVQPVAEVADSQVEQANTEPKDAVQPKEVEAKAAGENGQNKKDQKGHGSKKYHAKSKFDASLLPDTDDPEEIRTQVEFYFSDSNLGTDKYLWELTGGPENKPVKLKKICAFRRMNRFKPYEAIVEALRKSKILDVSGPAGEEELTRKKPYNIQGRARFDAATVYVKGFGDEEPSTQFDLEAFFTKFGPVNAVRLRRSDDNQFKGSVYVEFQDAEAAKSFLALDPKPQWKDQELKIMSKQEYVSEKNQLIHDGMLQPSKSKTTRFFEGKSFDGRGRGGRGRGWGRGGSNNHRDIDRDDWKQRREADQKNGFRGRGGGRGRGRGDHRRQERLHSRDNNVKPTIHTGGDAPAEETGKGSDAPAPKASSPTKRARDEDEGDANPAPAKKVDARVDAAAAEA